MSDPEHDFQNAAANEPADMAETDASPADSGAVQSPCGPDYEKIMSLPWEEILRHVPLKELLQFEGFDREGRAFWLILEPSGTRFVHLLAYNCLGVIARAPPGMAGAISLRPSEWGELRIERTADGTARLEAVVVPQEPVWGKEVEEGFCFGNIVDYIKGNALVVKAIAAQLEWRFIKTWDVPVEFAMVARHASTSDSAEEARRSEMAEHARLSEMAIRAEVAAATEMDFAQIEAMQGLIGRKMYLLKRGESSTLEILAEDRVALRVFVADRPFAEGTTNSELLAQIARKDCLMHVRLRPSANLTADLPPILWAVYLDGATNNLRAENLQEHNVVCTARSSDGRLVDAVKLSQERAPDDAANKSVVRIVNTAGDPNVVIAIWKHDPILPTLSPGRKVAGGRFTLTRLLGMGGMGVVWLAEDERLEEPVALKFLPPEIRADPASLDNLRRETLRSRKLSHPNIIRIHDMHEADGEPPFISMEYVDGLTLAGLRLRQTQRVLPWAQLVPIVQQLCEALDYAHRENVIHRDLKPANLMLDSKQRLKLADFGIAAVVSESLSRVSEQKIVGTLAYMSPQQLEGQRPQITDDIYALGATLYELESETFSGNVKRPIGVFL